jgi:uncharacterized protein (DUF2147 family)
MITQMDYHHKFLILMAPLMGLVGCASSPQATYTQSSMEGFWQLADGTSIVEISPCAIEAPTLCGRLVKFEGDKNTRDYNTPDIMAWGSRICGSMIISNLTNSTQPHSLTGSLYDPERGERYNLILSQANSNVVQAQSYLGTTGDEIVDVAISALLGSPPSLLDGAYLAIRGSLGKRFLRESEVWHRVRNPDERCDIPELQSYRKF